MNIKELSEQYPDNHTTTVFYTPPYHLEPVEVLCLVPTSKQYNDTVETNDYFELIRSCVKSNNIDDLLDRYPGASTQIGRNLLEACRLVHEEEQKVIQNKIDAYKGNVGLIAVGFEALINNQHNTDRKAFVIYVSRLLFYIDSFFTGEKK